MITFFSYDKSRSQLTMLQLFPDVKIVT